MDQASITTAPASVNPYVRILTESGVVVQFDYPAKALALCSQTLCGEVEYSGNFDCKAVTFPSNNKLAIDIVAKWMPTLYKYKSLTKVPKRLLDITNYLPLDLDMVTKIHISVLCDDLKLDGLLQVQQALNNDVVSCVSGCGAPFDIKAPKVVFDLMKYPNPVLTNTAINTFASAIDISDNELNINKMLEPLVDHPHAREKIAEMILARMEVTCGLEPTQNEMKELSRATQLAIEDGAQDGVGLPWEDVSLEDNVDAETWGLIYHGKMAVIEEVEVEIGGEELDGELIDDFELI